MSNEGWPDQAIRGAAKGIGSSACFCSKSRGEGGRRRGIAPTSAGAPGGTRQAASGALLGMRVAFGRLISRSNDFGDEAEALEDADGEPGEVELPPAMAVGGGPLLGVVVVVPAFAVCEEADEPVVAAVVVGFVV